MSCMLCEFPGWLPGWRFTTRPNISNLGHFQRIPKKFLQSIFQTRQTHFRTNFELWVRWTWASESIICSLSSWGFWFSVTNTWKLWVFLKGVRMVPNELRDVSGSVWLHFGVHATIFDAFTSLNKRLHENSHRSWKWKVNLVRKMNVWTVFTSQGVWKWFSIWCEALSFPHPF